MDIEITWAEVLMRLVASLAAGALLGFNRGQHGRPAGLRTTALVCLTAGASLVLANIILGTTGRASDSFVTMDVMRLPLGVLTGVGFIGAGAILRKGDLIVGVTTAATLWFATMMGFCFGAGEYGLGVVLLVLGLFILWGMTWIEERMQSLRDGMLILRSSSVGPSRDEIARILIGDGYKVADVAIKITDEGRELRYFVKWYEMPGMATVPKFVDALAALPGVRDVEWDAMKKM